VKVAEQIKNGPFESGCRWFQLIFIKVQLFYFLTWIDKLPTLPEFFGSYFCFYFQDLNSNFILNCLVIIVVKNYLSVKRVWRYQRILKHLILISLSSRDGFFYSYLTDFSYFWKLQNRSKMNLLKVGVDGFS
jgi:hypothetical protein